MKKVIAILSIISDVILTGMFTLLIILGIYFNDKEIISDPFNYMMILVGLLCLIISILATKNIFKEYRGLWFLILGKLDVFCWFMFGYGIVKKEYTTVDGIGAMAFFSLLGITLALVSVQPYIHEKISNIFNSGKSHSLDSNKTTDSMLLRFEKFGPDYDYDLVEAYKEYIMSIKADETYKMSDEEIHKIWKYATMPHAYLFKWLIDRNYVSEKFLSEAQSLGVINEVNAVREGIMSPVRLLLAYLAYYKKSIDREDLLPEVAAFFDSYYINHGNSSSDYDLDYREVVQN